MPDEPADEPLNMSQAQSRAVQELLRIAPVIDAWIFLFYLILYRYALVPGVVAGLGLPFAADGREQ